MSKIYTPEGWVNWDYLFHETKMFCMVTGARGTGKTFGLMDYLTSKEIPFVYLRRLKTQLDQCATRSTNPFNALNAQRGLHVEPYRHGAMVEFSHSEYLPGGKAQPIGTPVALGVALSTVAVTRGVDFSGYDVILFDESIPMIGEKPIRNEFNAFIGFVETVNRNREIIGKPPVKVFLLANANQLANPYYTGWGFMRTALKMINGKQMMWRSPDNTRLMVMLLNSPISAAKAETALYKNAGDDFMEMAIDNTFRTDATNIVSYPIKECAYICSVGEIGVYIHKGTSRHYVSKVVGTENYYDGYGMRLKMWRTDYAVLRVLYLRNMIDFESYENELVFREYCEIK